MGDNEGPRISLNILWHVYFRDNTVAGHRPLIYGKYAISFASLITKGVQIIQ